MTKEQLNKFVNAIDVFYKRQDQLNNALEPFNSSYTMIEFCPEITSVIFDYIKEEFNDIGDWFGYWYWDLEKGTRLDLMEGCSESNGSKIDISTIDKLYEFLMKNKEETNNEN